MEAHSSPGPLICLLKSIHPPPPQKKKIVLFKHYLDYFLMQVIPPIILRATQVKKELEQIKLLQSKLESRENDVKELRMLLKTKQEEIGELNIRKDITEKKLGTADTKLTNITRDYELSLQKLQVKKLILFLVRI